MPDSPLSPDSNPLIRQDLDGNQNQIIGQVLGGMVVYGPVIYNTTHPELDAADANPEGTKIGPNPYKGLLAFQETDSACFFGRDKQIKELWEKFRGLYEGESRIRLLTIYGPSGSGKSSLARAGLIPELVRRPLHGSSRTRVVVMVPGRHPLGALASVLARMATNDPVPVAKSREFEKELNTVNSEGKFDGLQRIACTMSDIDNSPLIVLVDQWEEIYTYELSNRSLENLEKSNSFQLEQDAFIENLLYAAQDPDRQVSVIITVRSDFLGEVQKHPVLNQLFSEQRGFIVFTMNEAGLRDAIRKPAELAGHPMDQSIVSLFLEQSKGREGVLPLLQFALQSIWEGLKSGKEPAITLDEIGGVGGALAKTAQQIYEGKLTPIQQKMAQRIFLGLVQLGEGSQDSRRRLTIESLAYEENSLFHMQKVINQFAKSDIRIITCSSDDSGTRTAELTHEVLIQEWQLLRDWIKDNRENLRQIRHLESEAEAWAKHGKSKGDLLGATKLERIKDLCLTCEEDLPVSVREFIKSSAKEIEASKKKSKQQKQINIFSISLTICIISVFISFIIFDENNKELELAKRVSAGEKILIQFNTKGYKKAGSLAFSTSLRESQKEYEYLQSSIDNFTSSLRVTPDDPETQIYLSNAMIKRDHLDHYTIAVTVPASSNADIATEILRGVAIVQHEVNTQRDINGRKLFIRIADDAIDPKIGKDLAKKFLKDKNLGVIAVVGHFASVVSLEAAPIYEEGKMVMITPTSINLDLSKSGQYIFRSTPRASDFAKSLANFVVISKKKTKVAICFDSQIKDSGSFKHEFLKNIANLEKYGAMSLDVGCERSANNISQFDGLDSKDISKNASDQNADAFLIDPYVNKISKAIDLLKQIKKDSKNQLTLMGNPTMESSDTLELGKNNITDLFIATVKKSIGFNKKLAILFRVSVIST
jgi:ABC-type branched-subunit amino acid transport system substrate-binding protein